MKSFYILGVGDNTAVYIDLLEDLGHEIAGLSHYEESRIGEDYLGHSINISNKELLQRKDLSDYNFALSMGDNDVRAELAKEIRAKGGGVPTLIHPAAVVSKYALLDEGVVIHANATIQAGSQIKNDSVVSANAVVIHKAVVSSGCYIAANATIGADVNLGVGVFIGLGAVIASKKVSIIAEKTVVGAGAIVIRDVEETSVLVGNPAKQIK